MAKRKFILRSQLEPPEYHGEVSSELSLTEPGQSLTAAEILQNFRLTGRTGLFDSAPGAQYDEDGTLEDFANLDKVEFVDKKRSVESRYNEYRERMENAQANPPANEVTTTPPDEGGSASAHESNEKSETK